MHAIRRYSTATLLAAALAAPASAGNILWTGAANDWWDEAANWSTNGVPGGGDDVILGNNAAPKMGLDGVAKSLTFNGADIAIFEAMPDGEAQLFLAGPTPIAVNAAADSDIWVHPEIVMMGSTQSIVVPQNHTLSFTGGIGQGFVPVTLNKLGTGELRVSSTGQNPLTGNFNVLSGTLTTGGDALGTAQVNVSSGATLNATSLFANDVHVGGNGFGGAGALIGGRFDGGITLTSHALFNDTHIGGSITDGANSFRLTFAPGSYNLLRNANTYDGGTVLGEDAQVTITNANALGTGRVDVLGNTDARIYLQFTGGSVDNEFVIDGLGAWNATSERHSGVLITTTYQHNAIAGNVHIREYGGIAVHNEGSLTIDGAVLHDASAGDSYSSLRKMGLGKLVLTNAGNTFTQLAIFDGTVHAAGQGTISSANLAIHSDATLELSGSLTHARYVRIGGEGYLGRGALRSVAGHNTIDHPLIVTAAGLPQQAGIAAIGVEAGSTLTLADDIRLDTQQYRVGMRKLGQGTLILTGDENQMNRDWHIEGGTLSIATDAHLGAEPTNTIYGSGNSTLLVRESMTTGRTFNFTNANIRAAAGATVGFGGIVNGATLRGPGSFHLGGGASLANVTTLVGTNVTQAGDMSASNLNHMGRLANQSGTLAWDGGENRGDFDVHDAAVVSSFLNTGRIHVHGGATLANSGSDLYSAGGSRITVDTNAAIGLGGHDLQLDGALLTNNGAVTGGTIHVNYGSTVKGAGTFGQIALSDGGVFSPGNSPGLTQTGDVTFAAGGTYLWEINDAAGLPAVQYDQWVAEDLTITAGETPNAQFTIRVATLLGNNADGPMANFDAEGSYQWTLLTADSISGFDAGKFALDLTGFANAYTHDFAIGRVGDSLVLGYNVGAVPEPASVTLAAIGAGSLLVRRRRA